LKEKNKKFFKISLDNWIQIAITVFTVISGILMAVFKSKWAYVFGLISQPFWHFFAIRKKHWGVEFVNILYTIINIIGFYNWFFVFK